jgi:4-hydroxythreonine-4-phosphate dehydrogenase
MRKPRVAVLTGDPGGIGPEVVAKVLAEPDARSMASVLLIADPAEVNAGMRSAGSSFPLQQVADPANADWSRDHIVLWPVVNATSGPFARGEVSAVNGRHSIEALTRAAEAALDGLVQAVCFAPLNKGALHLAGLGHADEAQWFGEIMHATGPVGELNVLDGLWTSRVTSHVPLKDVASLVTPERILAAVDLVAGALRAAGVEHPRVAVCGLNPHNGDHGAFGREEIDVIAPALEVARGRGVQIVGLFPADTIFLRAKDVDAIVTMYHDQGQIAMKLMGFSRGVTVHAGLPVPVVTPAHGTAFDIYGRGVASPGAMKAAFEMACRMAGRLRG